MAHTSSKRYRFSVGVNIVLLCLLLASLIHEQYVQRLYRRITAPEERPVTYADNPVYQHELSFYPLYQEQKNIVFLGDSYVSHIHWHELLERCDVAGRGVGNDVTEGMLHRLDAVLNLKPKICFVEGGNNDVGFDSTGHITINNLSRIADTLLRHGVTPVLHTISPVGAFVHDAASINARIRMTNDHIRQLAATRQLHLIDLYALFTQAGAAHPEFYQSDGTHLNSRAYLLWKKEIMQVLEAENLQSF